MDCFKILLSLPRRRLTFREASRRPARGWGVESAFFSFSALQHFLFSVSGSDSRRAEHWCWWELTLGKSWKWEENKRERKAEGFRVEIGVTPVCLNSRHWVGVRVHLWGGDGARRHRVRHAGLSGAYLTVRTCDMKNVLLRYKLFLLQTLSKAPAWACRKQMNLSGMEGVALCRHSLKHWSLRPKAAEQNKSFTVCKSAWNLTLEASESRKKKKPGA